MTNSTPPPEGTQNLPAPCPHCGAMGRWHALECPHRPRDLSPERAWKLLEACRRIRRDFKEHGYEVTVGAIEDAIAAANECDAESEVQS